MPEVAGSLLQNESRGATDNLTRVQVSLLMKMFAQVTVISMVPPLRSALGSAARRSFILPYEGRSFHSS